jgi:predicted RNA-binding Zn-ribbon protein involved in translation (DUF1610 family)
MTAATTDGNGLQCYMCGVKLELAEAKFAYLGHVFSHTVFRCPSCGLTFIPESLAEGRMSEVETMLEDK